MLAGTGNRAAATEFAFLVGIPTMYAASGYELLKTFKDGGAANEDWTGLGIAFVVSTIVAFVAVKWLLSYIRSNRFTVFAIYRIILGVILLGLACVRRDRLSARVHAQCAVPHDMRCSGCRADENEAGTERAPAFSSVANGSGLRRDRRHRPASTRPCTAATEPGATKEPARITSAAHANRSAIDLPIEESLSKSLIAHEGAESVGGRAGCVVSGMTNSNKCSC